MLLGSSAETPEALPSTASSTAPLAVDPTTLMQAMLEAALAAADPGPGLRAALPQRPADGRLLVLGAGKASARMAQVLEQMWGPCEGLIVVPEGARLRLRGLEQVEASHPVPDGRSAEAAARMLALAGTLGPRDTLVVLLSGGASALLAAPADGLTLADKQSVTRMLLRSGAPIDEMNLVRQQFSAIKGGRLAAAAKEATVLTYLVSDIPGDRAELIGSGPTFPSVGSAAEALAVIARHGIALPARARAHLERAADQSARAAHLGPAPRHVIVASPQGALEAAASVARAAGVTPCILGDAIEGEAVDVGRVMAGIAQQSLRHGQPFAPPVAFISGGETTVTVRNGAGKGGRCSEYLLSFLMTAAYSARISAMACDTDGRDGSEHNAGAIWQGGKPFDRTDARRALEEHDAWTFFERNQALVQTGPTHTNVNDFRVALVL
ncbi:glycerate kinase (plasmid) [Paracoccus pantotrophus]|jgi:hydroxypyruvate reductase|uniref:Glycerate kinase n=3 Tax=Paracoccaceae TaxID=31989 RepID=A0AAE6NUC1_PARPN|nr:glycerate kinase [Paracoccus pantotrophus]